MGELLPYCFSGVFLEREMAKAQSLWSRLEGPVRADGQIVPETFEAELPRLVEALKKRGLALEIVTSDILAVTPRAEKVRRTAAMLGIRRFRIGGVCSASGSPSSHPAH